MALQQFTGRRRQLGQLGAVDGLDERLAAREVPVERADTDAGIPGNRLERYRGRGGGERLGGLFQQPLAVTQSVCPDARNTARLPVKVAVFIR